MTISGDALQHKIIHILEQKSGQDIVYIDLAGKSDMADGMIIATGTSSRHVATLADYAARALKDAGGTILSETGKESGEWVLIDSPNIMVHVFKAETRALYQLEKMWDADFSYPNATARPDGEVAV